jgi:branched-chain amino acid transport system ATP-binding protein
MSLLNIFDLSVHYARALVLHHVNLEVGPTECVGVIGPNGAGKTTLLRSISGIKDWEGEITFEAQSLKNQSSQEIVRLGIVQAPEGRHLFPQLTVRENFQLGAFLIKDKSQIAANLQYVMNLFPHLMDRSRQLAGTLSGGEQQMVCIGRALMSSPKLLLLDEPSLGLAPRIKDAIAESIRQIQNIGVTILLVEQDAHMALDLAQRVNVIEQGTIVMSGQSADLSQDPRIKSTYLGLS